MAQHEWLVDVGAGRLRCYAAATPESRRLGLQAFDRIGSDEGLLFLFDGPGDRGFHMARVGYPIDIIWTKAGVVTHVVRGEPGSSVTWSAPADRVIETAAGAAGSVRRGDRVSCTRLVTAQEREPELVDPAKFAYALAPFLLQAPLQWDLDTLTNGATSHAIVTPGLIRSAVDAVSATDESDMREVALSPRGMDAIATALIAMGACETAKVTPYGIVLQRL